MTVPAVPKHGPAVGSDGRPNALTPFLSCGLDLMPIVRLEREVACRGDSLIEELFQPAELAWCRRRRRAAEGYALAYASKEALFKALGTGKAGRMAWHDVEVAWPDGSAQPAMMLAGETAAVAAAMGVSGVHLSLASTKALAVAWVMLTGFGTRDSGFAYHAETKPPSSIAKPPEPRAPSPESRQTQENR
jgi:holo-[acyl-carrier protein] synthase